MERSKIEWAKYWSDLGFSVIPVHYVKPDGSCSCSRGADCESPGKHPAPARWKKYQERKADADTLEMWFGGQYKDYNIGVVTGKVSNNVFVVDVDVGEGKPGVETLDDLCMANDDLPDTLEQITGSGGRHYFFQAPENVEIITGKNTLGEGIDTRGEGGFVVVAPSNHKSGNHYNLNGHADNPFIEQSPEWLREMSLITAHHVGGSSLQETTTNLFGTMTDGREGYMVQLILGTIRTWWAQKGELPTVDQLVEDAWPTYQIKVRARGRSLEDDGRGEDQFRRKAYYQLQRAKNNELRILKDVAPASEKNVVTPSDLAFVDPSAKTRVEEGKAINPPDQPSLRISDWGVERYSGEAPQMDWLIENILPRRVPGLLASIGGLGKSYLLLDLALKVAGGDQVMHKEDALGGKVTHNGKVVVLGAEDSQASVHRRLDAIAGTNLLERARNNLFVVPLPDAGGPVPLISNVMGEYSATPQYIDIRQQLLEMGDIALIVVDPLQAFAHADINTDPAAAQFFWSLMSELCVSTDANIIIAHHMRKEGAFNIKKSVGAREAIRGTTSLVDGARWVYALWAMNEADEMVVAQNMDLIEAGIGQCANGGVVKINDQADMSVRSFIRAETGLLEDRTAEIDAILDASTKLDVTQVNAIFDEIEARWNNEHPFSMAMNTDRSLTKYIAKEYGMPKRSAASYVNSWEENGCIQTTIVSAKSKQKGIQVISRPVTKAWSAA